MQELNGRMFWNNFDNVLLKKGENLTVFAERTGIGYKTMSVQRTRHSIPNIIQVFKMATALDVSIEHLLTGQEDISNLSPEAKAVQNDKELQALVRAILRDRRLLSAISAVVNSYEDNAHIG